jgi:hypothetical protein
VDENDSGWKLAIEQACLLNCHLRLANDAKLRPSHPSFFAAGAAQ